jgi:type II secretory pathway component PulF
VIVASTSSPLRADANAANKKVQFSLAFGPSAKDVQNFTSQLAVMIRAGISIRSAIEGIADQVENPKFKAMLVQMKRDVESGKQFSTRCCVTRRSSARSTSTW